MNWPARRGGNGPGIENHSISLCTNFILDFSFVSIHLFVNFLMLTTLGTNGSTIYF